MAAAAFFDLDNTVVRGSSLLPFASALVRSGRISMADLMHFVWLNARFVTTRTESMSGRDFVTTRALELVAGQRVPDVADLCRRMAPAIIRRRTNLGVVHEIRRHRTDGRQTWLVTASPVELASELARVLGMTGALGTEAATKDGVYTGELAGPILHGSHKAEAIIAMAAVEGFDLQECSAYSDSMNDLPMLSLVGDVTVVNANKSLRQVAWRNGWRVMEQPDRITSARTTEDQSFAGPAASSVSACPVTRCTVHSSIGTAPMLR